MQQPSDLLQLTLQTVSATQRTNASQRELDAVGQLFDQVGLILLIDATIADDR